MSSFFTTQSLSLVVGRAAPHQKYISGLVLGWTRKTDSNVSPIPSVNVILVVKKCECGLSFRPNSLQFRKGAKYLKCTAKWDSAGLPKIRRSLFPFLRKRATILPPPLKAGRENVLYLPAHATAPRQKYIRGWQGRWLMVGGDSQ